MTALSFGAVILTVFAGLLGLGIVAGLLWLVWKVLKVVLWVLGRVLRFAKSEVVDTLHAAGALVTAGVTVPLAAVNLAILRLGAARRYGRAFVEELGGVGAGLWRVALANPLRLVGLGALVEGVERRFPDVAERAPRPRRARRATFEGYDVVGTLPSGGSGAQLFVARPKSATHQRFLKAGRGLPGEVVIKSFALEAGSTLPQIVRESRALEAASALGLVCEHQLTEDHFYYVMPYVKGEDLERVTRALHARGTAEGLADAELQLVLTYAIDLLDSLQRFHSGGLWHKDVKPTNVIVARGRAHLVDFGLVTPLASALTLTTHGTEYYRDPEMVRLAMQGVRVHEVDGVRFDLYSAGAVLYSMLENGFPAHGSLSRLSKRAPEALRWIVQRAMAEMSSRYASASEMRADLAALAAARDPFDVRPADLPSFQRAGEPAPAGPAPLPAPLAAPRPAAFEAPAFAPAAMCTVDGTRRRRRSGPALACAAAGFFGLFMLASGVAFFAGHARHGAAAAHAARTRTVARASEERPWASLSPRERKLLDLAQDVAQDLAVASESTIAPAAAARVPAVEPVAVSDERADPTAGVRGRVLVLDDVAAGADARVLALLRSRLVERGITVVGQGGDDEGAVELLASARHALGLGRAEEPETQASLQGFLDASEELDALILVSRSDDEAEHLYRVFVKERTRAGQR